VIVVQFYFSVLVRVKLIVNTEQVTGVEIRYRYSMIFFFSRFKLPVAGVRDIILSNTARLSR
jgi:hypothetical protein